MKIRAIVTGVTGMVGEGVLHECLQHPDVEHVLILTRRPSGVSHPKVVEIVHPDFHDITPIAGKLTNYNACFFCLGVTSIGKNEAQYTKLTYDLTLHVAKKLAAGNPGMTFCYISGAGTDSTEKGKVMWARVKGKTENDLLKLPFKQAYMFRPGLIQATPGLKNTLQLYKYFSWMVPLLKTFFPSGIVSLKEIGQAMINVVQKSYKKPVLEIKDIKTLARDKQL
jgi:uncharacterized protein YbjT (DUF2867 family)